MVFQTERRQCPRAPVKWPVIIQTAQRFIAGETKDISASGAFINCWKPLEVNEVFEMAISVSLLDSPIRLTAEVIRSDIPDARGKPGSGGMGVRFTKISEEDRQLISAAVSGNLKSACDKEPHTE